MRNLALLLIAVVGITSAADVIDPETCTEFPCLIFEDNFDFLDHSVWQHEINMGGAGNFEFQAYVNNRSVSYTRDGLLYIKPDLMSNWKDEEFLSTGDLDFWGMNGDGDVCTGNLYDGCRQQGTDQNILMPTTSARLRTMDNFEFKYGRAEIRAKMPKGDWLWPAVWLLPWRWPYGLWPASGEIDILEIRGNEEYGDNNEFSHYYAGTTLHWGPYAELNSWYRTHADYTSTLGEGVSFSDEFHTWAMEWTDNDMRFFLDGEEKLVIDPVTNFYDFGEFANVNSHNPWEGKGKMAPYNQKFYLIMNVAVGGTGGFFPDGIYSNPPKPWDNTSPTARKDFWEARNDWYPTWQQGGNSTSEGAALQVDYVKVYKMSQNDMQD